MSPVWIGDKIVGEITSAAYGHRVQKAIALAMLDCTDAPPDTQVEVEIFGRRVLAAVHADAPLWDPENERIRA